MATWTSRLPTFGILGALSVAAFVSRYWRLHLPIGYFETYTMARTFQGTSVADALARGDESFLKLAFYYWSMDALVDAFGPDLVVVRTVSLCFGTLGVIYAYLLGRELFSRAEGMIFAAFAAVLPVFVSWGAHGRTYAIEMTLTLMSWLYFVRLVSPATAPVRPRVETFAYFVVGTVALYLQATYVALLGSQIAIALCLAARRPTGGTRLALIGGIATLAAYMPMVPFTLRTVGHVQNHGDGIPGLTSMFAQLLLPATPVVSAALGAAVLLAGTALAWRKWRRGERRTGTILATMTAYAAGSMVAALGVDAVLHRTLNVRYILLYTLPLLVVFAAVLVALARAVGLPPTAVPLVAATLGLGAWHKAPKPQSGAFEKLAEFVASEAGETAPLVTDRAMLMKYALRRANFKGRIYEVVNGEAPPLPPGPVWVFAWTRFPTPNVDFRRFPHAVQGPFLVYRHPNSSELRRAWSRTPAIDRMTIDLTPGDPRAG